MGDAIASTRLDDTLNRHGLVRHVGRHGRRVLMLVLLLLFAYFVSLRSAKVPDPIDFSGPFAESLETESVSKLSQIFCPSLQG